MDTLSQELTRIADLMEACATSGAPQPTGLIVFNLRLLDLAAAMQELEMALLKGETNAEQVRPIYDSLIARQAFMLQSTPSEVRDGGRLQ